jgi:hypothetical protein
MERIYFKTTLENISTKKKTIFTADNASGYFESKEFHAVGEYHFVYKFSGDQIGWYMQNPADFIDRYLCEGACPTMLVENLQVLDEEIFAAITIDNEANQEQAETDEEITEEKKD